MNEIVVLNNLTAGFKKRIKELEAEVEELKKYKRRLDFLEKYRIGLQPESGRFKERWFVKVDGHSRVSRCLIAIIDEIMAEKKEPGILVE